MSLIIMNMMLTGDIILKQGKSLLFDFWIKRNDWVSERRGGGGIDRSEKKYLVRHACFQCLSWSCCMVLTLQLSVLQPC